MNGNKQVADVEGEARMGLALDPIDARFFSSLAELEKRKGDEVKANLLFDTAHKISRTEFHALLNVIRISVERGSYGKAVRTADALFRRWPERFNELAPVIGTLITEEEAYSTLLELAGEGLPWRGRLMNYLAEHDEFRPLAHRLLLDLSQAQVPASSSEKAAVINGYWRQGNYADAYRLFLMSLNEAERDLTGFVHNSGFSRAQEPQIFAWTYRNTPEADIRFSDAPPPYNGAILRFLDKPAREVVLMQTLVLPQGRYRLTVNASAFNLKMPRELFLIVSCGAPNRELVRLTVPEGNYRESSLESDFEVADCPAQSIRLATGLVAESWSYRYSGEVVFHDVSVTRASVDQNRS
ncbi:hypothetical protein SAMN02982922_2431 [Mesorhizobium australicum]|uniref:Uncharacterized protein n=1 Tax=Mesorhizobium australicum TaxID=536018 RepID=A0A1X7NRZ2_9HYPH|nr:hypothetical protein SAMN02982922_2431 [Mesorhizobium australicum]